MSYTSDTPRFPTACPVISTGAQRIEEITGWRWQSTEAEISNYGDFENVRDIFNIIQNRYYNG